MFWANTENIEAFCHEAVSQDLSMLIIFFTLEDLRKALELAPLR